MYDRFEELLKVRNVTPYKVSQETGVSQPTLSDWKRGTSTPKTDKLQKIADYFGVSLDYLIGKSDIPGTDEDVKEILSKKEGLYFKFAKTAEELDLSEDDLQFIMQTYLLHKKHRDKE